LLRANGEWIRLEAGGSVLGGFAETVFEEDSVHLDAGDRLLLFTDGLTEAWDQNGEQFGEKRLIELLLRNKDRSAEDLKEIVFQAVEDFSGQTFEDDAALMVIAIA
jgi:sigma-B regulation protein RsbU (phosphoserine phosphatase)